MRRYRNHLILITTIAVFGLSLTFAAAKGPKIRGNGQLISQSALLAGLAAGAVFPFVDTTPHKMARAHIAITDATTNCTPGAAPPLNMQILVGQAGGTLTSVMTSATNTGISTTGGQCVFHVTVTAGAGGVPATLTDIIVRNVSGAALTGVNTITTSAEVGDDDD